MSKVARMLLYCDTDVRDETMVQPYWRNGMRMKLYRSGVLPKRGAAAAAHHPA